MWPPCCFDSRSAIMPFISLWTHTHCLGLFRTHLFVCVLVLFVRALPGSTFESPGFIMIKSIHVSSSSSNNERGAFKCNIWLLACFTAFCSIVWLQDFKTNWIWVGSLCFLTGEMEKHLTCLVLSLLITWSTQDYIWILIAVKKTAAKPTASKGEFCAVKSSLFGIKCLVPPMIILFLKISGKYKKFRGRFGLINWIKFGATYGSRQ